MIAVVIVVERDGRFLFVRRASGRPAAGILVSGRNRAPAVVAARNRGRGGRR
jgi:hypothetical protein